MAFGINREELIRWKQRVKSGEIALLTHYWQDSRFKGCYTVTKAGCNDINKLIDWGIQYDLKKEWIDYHSKYPHFDLFGNIQKNILLKEGYNHHIHRFKL